MSCNSVEELEEGEIYEETPPISLKSHQGKVLPRRYVLHENKSLHYRHKKTCKHAVHSYAKKMAKLKEICIKSKDPHKKHHKSCCRHAVGKTPKHVRRHISPVKKNSVNSNVSAKNAAHFNSHSLFVEMKNNFKNRLRSPHKISLPRQSNFEKQNTNLDTKNSVGSDSSNLELLSNCSKLVNDANKHNINGSLKSANFPSTDFSKVCDPLETNKRTIENDLIKKCLSDKAADSVIKENGEESEDEEELRRKALASCAKRMLLSKNILDEKNKAKIFSSNSVCKPLAVQDKAVSSQSAVDDTQAVDNYEVIDMDVDEEEEEIVCDDKLFTIDKNPTPLLLEEFKNIKSAEEPVGHSSSCQCVTSNQIDDDFEEDLLRAELISNMINQKKMDIDLQDKKEVSEKKEIKVKHTCGFQNTLYKPIKPALKKMPIMARKPVINSLKPELNIVSSERNKIVKPQERVIINVGGTSSEESDEDDDSLSRDEINKENAVASIEALISNARQKSDENNANNKVNNVPDAVSCLSKAQQEEYNSLVKLLAKKNKVPLEHKKPATHSPTEDLKVLEKRFVIAETNFGKEKTALTNMQKEFIEQKNVYVKSRLTVQYLKEKLIAAERIRKSNLKSIRTTVSKMGIIKNAVLKREAVVNELKNECTKLGVSIRGQNYTLPSISSALAPQINPTL